VQPLSRILVAGCGAEGREVIDLAKRGNYEVVGFDIALKPELHQQRGENWLLLRADVLDLPFEDASFDAVLYYHVIEHGPNPARSLAELARVLRVGGGMLIGTPNRARLVGYLGSNASCQEKIRCLMRADLRITPTVGSAPALCPPFRRQRALRPSHRGCGWRSAWCAHALCPVAQWDRQSPA